MEVALQQAVPLGTIEGSKPACNKGKRNVFDNEEVEQSYKFKAYPLVMKATLAI